MEEQGGKPEVYPRVEESPSTGGSEHRRNLELWRTVIGRSIQGFDRNRVKPFERVVVTGGAGHVGSQVLRLLTELGSTHLVSFSKGAPGNRKVQGVEYQCGRLEEPRAFERLLASVQPDLVIHLAAERDPGRAERTVRNTVLTNVVGTQTVLNAVLITEVPVFVAASTGKAMRLFTSDVYASTKQLLEYSLTRAAQDSATGFGAARFTHLVGNSIILERLTRWARRNECIKLHGANVDLFVQSTIEAAQLLLLTANLARARSGKCWITAIKDLGWPPVDLQGLAQDLRHELHSASEIRFVGFPLGYEERPYPGTTDPRTAGNHSPLVNALEASQTIGVPQLPPSVEAFTAGRSEKWVDHAVRNLELASYGSDPTPIREALGQACLENLRRKLKDAPLPVLERMSARGTAHALVTEDHIVAHQMVLDELDCRVGQPGHLGSAVATLPSRIGS